MHESDSVVEKEYFNSVQVVSHVPLLAPITGVQQYMKRALDIVLSLFFIVVLSPVFLITTITLFFTPGHRILFTQWRYGKNNKPFKLYKFCTMSVEEDGFVVETVRAKDSRITRIGRFLRKYSVDELPQFFNVLKGDMSLVGPRPHAIAMVDEYVTYVKYAKQRHVVKPGLTGLAQINGTRGAIQSRNDIKDMIYYDLEYIKKRTILLDAKIILLTAFKVLFDNDMVV